MVNGLDKVTSFYWSGYADNNKTNKIYSAVTGSWMQPKVICTKEHQLVVFFVGLDGANGGMMEDAGTFVDCLNGTATYYTWWAMPTVAGGGIQVEHNGVQSGDMISASVVENPATSYTLTVNDATNPANSFTTAPQMCPVATCPNDSAEWIAGTVTGARGLFPLAEFKPWGLTGATVTTGAPPGGRPGVISDFPRYQITMIDSTQTYPLAEPGALNAAGNGFTVTWKNSF